MSNKKPLEMLMKDAEHWAKQGPRGRYAPSPTGVLHLGNLRTALLAWLQTRLCGGTFVLRMEDLDPPRVRKGSAEQILADLRWLGLDWDEGPDTGGPLGPYTQSQRIDIYNNALEILIAENHLFPCFCSRKDILNALSAPHDYSDAIYPGTCRLFTSADIPFQRRRKQGREPAWRYRVPEQFIVFHDEIAGEYRQALHTQVGDFVVRRSDLLFAYQLAVVIDDMLMAITDVVRGADLLHSTPRQIQLFQSFGAIPPHYYHVPLMRDEEGERLGKRRQSTSLDVLRQQGKRPAEVIGMLAASVGLAEPGDTLSTSELLQNLDLDRYITTLQHSFQTNENDTTLRSI